MGSRNWFVTKIDPLDYAMSRNCFRHTLGGARCSITRPGDDDINIEADKFSRKTRILITLAPAIAVLECDVFLLDPAEFA